MYNKSISKSRVSRVLPNFVDELLMAFLQISVYLLNGSDIIRFEHYKTADYQLLNQILLVIYC